MALTIDDLLNALQNPNKPNPTLPNTAETWKRIRAKDPFLELGLSPEEKDEFLKEWLGENEYSVI